MFLFLTLEKYPSTEAVVAKAEQDPQLPWFLTDETTLPPSVQSKFSGTWVRGSIRASLNFIFLNSVVGHFYITSSVSLGKPV